MTLTDDKSALREIAKRTRAVAAAAAPGAAEDLGAVWPVDRAVGQGSVIGGYSPIRSEIDPRPLMARLEAQGALLAMPVMRGEALPLMFRAWTASDDMDDAAFGVREPKQHSPRVVPDILLVPLLAFDRRGRRLGYGGGYYDRTIAELKARGHVQVIGLAYADQEVSQVPVDQFDQTLDGILTDAGWFSVG